MSAWKSIFGKSLGIQRDGKVAAPGGLVSGGGDKPTVNQPGPDDIVIFDDFLGSALDTGLSSGWSVLEGTDTGADGSYGIVGSAHGGIVRLQAPRNFGMAAAAATDMVALVGTGTNFSANNGLRMTTRIRINDTGTTPNDVLLFVGFSDDTGTLEFPVFTDSGTKSAASGSGDLTAVATNAFGMLYDTQIDTGLDVTADRWLGVSVDAGTIIPGAVGGDVGASVVQASSGMETNKWKTLEMVLESGLDGSGGDTGGVVNFFLDGVGVGSISAPVASSSTLAPWIGIHGRGSGVVDTVVGSVGLDIDYVSVRAARDTGD